MRGAFMPGRSGRKDVILMTIEYKARFDEIEWDSPMEGVRHKCIDRGDSRVRLVEYSREMPPHWCEKGHQGYVIEGEMDIEFENTRAIYGPGDVILIPDGPEHKHRARVLSGRALVFLVERA